MMTGSLQEMKLHGIYLKEEACRYPLEGEVTPPVRESKDDQRSEQLMGLPQERIAMVAQGKEAMPLENAELPVVEKQTEDTSTGDQETGNA